VASPKQSTQTTTSVKLTRRRQRRGQRNNRNQSGGQVAGPQLSGCALDYARCLANPFTGPIACVPTYPAMLTRRMKAFCKGVFNTGTAGFGYILANPNSGAANDVPAVTYSTAASAVSTTSATIAVDPAMGFAVSNSEYLAAQFGTTPALAKYRVVGCGLKIRYVGTQLNLGGQIIGLHEPDHNNLASQSIANFDAQTESRRLVPDRQWTTVLYKPVTEDELLFRPDFPSALFPTVDGVFYMGFIIQSAVAAQPFEFEYYGVYEMEGRNLRGKVPSHNDPLGHAAVHTIASTSTELYPTKKNDGEREQSFISRALDYLGSGISHTSKLIGHVNTASNVASAASKAVNASSFWGRAANFAARAAMPIAEEALMLAL